MGSLLTNASPFLFPCTIEYSLICAVILFEMWKKVKTIDFTKKNEQEETKESKKKNKDHRESGISSSQFSFSE